MIRSCLSEILSSNAKQVIFPFVEAKVKGRVILIKRTTAIRLFQEIERVSADRFIRVRLKQPYASCMNSPKQSDAVERLDNESTPGSTVDCNGQKDDQDIAEEAVKGSILT